MDGNFGRYGRAGLLAATAIVCTAAASPAQAQTRSFNVPAQGADSGVSAFARQADIQLLISARDARGKRTNEVRGNFSVADGLRRLLDGTGLRAQATGAQTYSVVPTEAAAEAAEGSADTAGVAEILVVGSRSQNVDIRRTENDAQPYVVFTQEDLERSRALVLEDFFRTRLPMNATQDSATDTSTNSEAGNAGQIDLRGLGADETLVLVNGRRIPSVFDGRELRQGNINGIPVAAIERIEVLPSSASGIYGGGATGGVVNIILKSDYSGLELGIIYRDTDRFDAGAVQLSAAGGTNLEGGRTNILFSAGYTKTSDLLSSERPFNRESTLLTLRNNPSAVTQPPRFGLTPNIRTVNGANLVLDTGANLGSAFASVPLGYAGPSGDFGAALASTAGTYNLDGNALNNQLVQASEIVSVNGSVRRRMSSWLELFADFSFDRTTANSSREAALFVTLAANSTNNPFQQQIRVGFPLVGSSLDATRRVENIRSNVGGIFRLPGEWSIAIDGSWSRSTSSSQRETQIRPTTAGNAYLQTIALRDSTAFPIDYSAANFNAPDTTSVGPYTLTQRNLSARASGSAIDLPAGRIALTALLEYREERLSNSLITSTSLGVASMTYTPPASRNVSSAYLEARIPIVAPRMAPPFAHSLDLLASVRYDDYTLVASSGFFPIAAGSPPPAVAFGRSELSSTDYTLGLRYEPVEGLILRGSYATGFLPPGISQLTGFEDPFAPGDIISFQLVDPRRGNTLVAGELGPVIVISGGNDQLRPETSESLSAGFVATPGWLPGARFSVDYTRISKRNEITTPVLQFVLSNEALLPGNRITRGPNLPGDPAGWAGPITRIDGTLVNLLNSRVEALDVRFDYDLRTRTAGIWHFYLTATKLLSSQRRLFAADPMTEFVGSFDGPLEWRANAGLTLQLGGWTVSWDSQYFGPYAVTFADPASASLNPARIASQGRVGVPGQWYHDLLVRYAFEIVSGHRTEVSLGIQNLFDRDPPIIASALSATYSPYGNALGRRFTLSVRQRF